MSSLETIDTFVFQPSGKDVGSRLKKIGPIDEIDATLGVFDSATIGDLTVSGSFNGSPAGSVVFINAAQTLANKSLVDASTFIVDETDDTKRIGFDAAGTTGTTTTLAFAQTANRLLTFPDTTDTIVARATTDTLSNKSLVDTTTFVVDAVDSTKRIGFNAAGTTGTTTTLLSSQTANRILTLPDATDTLVARGTTDTLSNKLLVDTSTAIVDAADTTKRIGFSAGGATGTSTTLEFAQTANRLLTFPDATDTIIARATTDTLTNKSLVDATTAVVDSVDPTRRLAFNVAGTTGTTSTIVTSQTVSAQYILPDTAGATANFIIAETAQTFTGMKTFPGIILATQGANPGGGSTANTLWINTTNGHVFRGSVDIETSGVTNAASSSDNAITRFDGTTGQVIKTSTVWLEDNDRISRNGLLSTLLYEVAGGNFIGGGTQLATIGGTGNFIFGPEAGRFLAGAITGNTFMGTGAGGSMTGGSSNTLLGNNAGSAYTTNEGDNIIIGLNPGVASESGTTRIGNSQTKAFIAGIYGVTPAGPVQYAVVDASGQIGSADLSSITATATGTLSSATPVASTAYSLVKVGNSVTLQINSISATVAGSQATIVFNILPAGYRPAVQVEYAVAFVSGGTYDTGLIGTITIATTGVITLYRDRSGVQLFTGVSGLSNGWSVAFIAP